MTIKGIDVSYANGIIDWNKVKKSGIEYAILRSTFGSESPSQIDSEFFQNAQGCVKNNIPFGVYHFAYFVNEQKATEEANFVIKKANEYKKYVKFIALDVEEDSERYAKNLGYNPDWTKCAVKFMECIKAAGYTPILYANQSWITNKYNYDTIRKYKLWYAAPDATSPKYDATIWQYSWKGKVNGITGDVDMNYLYDDNLIKSSVNNATSNSNNANKNTNDKEVFLSQAKTYIGKNGDYVCNVKLKLGTIYDWCAFAVSSIMNDCGFIGKYIKQIEGGAGSIPRESDSKYGKWFKKYDISPQSSDLILFRYNSLGYTDKYHADHIGIVESVNGNTITTLEGNVDGDNNNWAATSMFKRKTRYLNNENVYAFYRPNWSVGILPNNKEQNNSKKHPSDEISQETSSSKVDFKVKITSSNGVNIRSGASTSYKILGAVPYGCEVRISRQTSGGGYSWGLTTYNGIKGWIALDFTKKVGLSGIKVGSTVRVKSGALVYGTNTPLSSWVYSRNFKVMEVFGDRAVIGIDGSVTAAVNKNDLLLK